MKLVKASYQITTPQHEKDILHSIEVAARTCYKSEGNITLGSDEVLFKKLVNRGHNAMLEFGYHPIFRIGTEDLKTLANIKIRSIEDENLDYYTNSQMEFTKGKRCLISGSLRIYRDLIKNHSDLLIVRQIANSIHGIFGAILIEDLYNNDWGWDGYVEDISIEQLSNIEKLHHIYPSVKFITNRGVSHEIVRHRIASYAQESTRFCNYEGKDMEFIHPYWFTSTCMNDIEISIQRMIDGLGESINFREAHWHESCITAEECYNIMIINGASLQDARDVLPNSLKTEINVSCNIREWREIFKQRGANAAHPQMQEVMRPLLYEFQQQIPILFNDITY